MEWVPLIVVSCLVLAYGAVSQRLRNTFISPAMVFVLFGLIVGVKGFGFITTDIQNFAARLAVELTLVMVLFTDGCKITTRNLWKEDRMALRLLWFGMPLIIIFGALIAFWLFDYLDGWQAALLAAVLAPTDAALGQAALDQKGIPKKISQNLIVESGLNDGLVVPVILFLTACESLAAGREWAGFWVVFFLQQVGFGVLVGLFAGYIGDKWIAYCHRKKLMTSIYNMVSGVAVALLAYSLSSLIGGNGFIAAFATGIVFGRGEACHNTDIHEFSEAISELLTLITFMLFGAIILPYALMDLSWQMFLYAILSLTVIRMAGVAIALIGMKLKPAELLFMGWMGPRGIASLLFGLLVLETLSIVNREMIFTIVAVTVCFSIFLHGLSAAPLSMWLARKK